MTPKYVTCQCQHCKNNIEFDANQIESAEQTVACPHCGLETKIFIAPKIIVPPKLQKPGSVSRIRVWIFLAVFVVLTILFFTVSGLNSFPTEQENADAKQVSALDDQQDKLREKSEAVLNQVTMGESTWNDYSNVNNQISDLYDQRLKLEVEGKIMADNRNSVSNGCLFISLFCCLFWIPAAIYLFLVPKR